MDSSGAMVDLPQVIDQATEISGRHLGDRQVTIVAEFPAHLPAVRANSRQVTSAVACLLARAGQLTSSREIKVRAELLSGGDKLDTLRVMAGEPEQLGRSGPWVVLRVSFADSGSAALEIVSQFSLPPAERGWILEGSGPLLADFGPRLWLESDQASETRFGMALPLWGVDEPLADLSSLRREVQSRLSKTGQEAKRLLLMVEDPQLRALLARDLEAADHQVVVAESGEQVLSLAREVGPDLVLLDLLARTPTAFEVAAILKYDRRTRNIPVMFLTSTDDPKGGMSMEAVSFLPRHHDTGALVSAIQAVLNSDLEPLGRVLIVEPDDHLRERMVMTIQGQEYRVSEARTAAEAMALAERAAARDGSGQRQDRRGARLLADPGPAPNLTTGQNLRHGGRAQRRGRPARHPARGLGL